MNEPVLLISDTHYHRWSSYSQTTADGMNSRLKDILRATLEAADALRKAGGKIIIHCGDVFHTRGSVSPQVLNPVLAMYQLLIKEGFQIHVISGNHDLETNDAEDLSSTATALKSVGVQVYNRTARIFSDGAHWTLVPWYADLHELRDIIKEEYTAPTLVRPLVKNNLILHAPLDDVIEGIPNHGLSPKDFEGTNWDNVFVGHYHNHRVFDFNAGRGRAVSVGALTHQTWGDAGHLAGYILYYPIENKLEQHETKAPKFLKVHHEDLDLMVESDIADNYIKVVANDLSDPSEAEDIKNRLKMLNAKAVVVEGLSKKPVATRTMTTGSTITAPTIDSMLADYISRTYPSDEQSLAIAQDILKKVTDD